MTVRKKARRIVWIVILLCVVVGAVITADSTLRMVTSEYDLSFANLPLGFDGYRIVQLSDIHGQSVETFIDRVRNAMPDIIVITGDMIDENTDMSFAVPLLTELGEIAPVYYITGNHEYDGADLSGLIDIMDGCGVTFLRNDFTILTSGGDSIVLAGIDDPNGRADMKTPEELFGEITDEAGDMFTIVLNHRNDQLSRLSGLGADLVLSGHAHGGIIRLPFTDGLIGPGMELLPKYTSGIYTQGDTTMIVSRGIVRHLRFLNNPEVVVITLKCE